MRKFFFIFVLLILASMLAAAQDEKAQVFAGYQFSHLSALGHGTNYPAGWDLDLMVKPSRNFGIVADVSGGYKNGANFHTFMVGPRLVGAAGKIAPFGEVLVGAARGSASGFANTKFSAAVGGGLDIQINRSVAFRLAKLDYNYVKIDGGHMNNVRYATGIVFKF